MGVTKILQKGIIWGTVCFILLFDEHCNILTEQIDQACPLGYNGSYISYRDNDASQARNTNNVISFSKIIDNV
jgi:hypothetical protein